MPSKADVDKKMQRRVQEVGRSTYRKVLESRACYETGAGVVVTESVYGDLTYTAHLFKPAQLKNAFKTIRLTSAHERIAVLDTLREIIAEEKAEKVAPHNLKKGDIIAQIWGSTMQGVDYHVVVDVPHPRKVSLVKVGSRYLSGDFMSGTTVPAIEPGTIPDGEPITYRVQMRNGAPYVQMGHYDRASLWDGKPVMVYSD